jgi:hypothetical protein
MRIFIGGLLNEVALVLLDLTMVRAIDVHQLTLTSDWRPALLWMRRDCGRRSQKTPAASANLKSGEIDLLAHPSAPSKILTISC